MMAVSTKISILWADGMTSTCSIYLPLLLIIFLTSSFSTFRFVICPLHRSIQLGKKVQKTLTDTSLILLFVILFLFFLRSILARLLYFFYFFVCWCSLPRPPRCCSSYIFQNCSTALNHYLVFFFLYLYYMELGQQRARLGITHQKRLEGGVQSI